MPAHQAGEHGSVHLCIGQEAVPVGRARRSSAGGRGRRHLPRPRLGHRHAGVPLAEMFAELLGRASALNGGRGGSPT